MGLLPVGVSWWRQEEVHEMLNNPNSRRLRRRDFSKEDGEGEAHEKSRQCFVL